MTRNVRPRLRPRLALGVTGALAALLLGACSLPDGAAPVPSSSSASEGGASGTPAPEPAVSTQTLTADGIELVLAVPLTEADAGDGTPDAPVTVTPDEDGSSRVALVLALPSVSDDGTPTAGSTTGTETGAATGPGDGSPTGSPVTSFPATLDLVSPADGSLVRNSDGSLSVLDAAGTPLGGISAPEATEESGSAARAAVVVVAPTRAEVHVRAEGAAPSGTADETAPTRTRTRVTVTTWLGAQGVRSATWGEREGGRSLAVDPTPWARRSGIVGEATAWAQLVASEPEANSTTLRDQFDCHALGATDKATWNLEPWRPDVGFLATAAARCNPTA